MLSFSKVNRPFWLWFTEPVCPGHEPWDWKVLIILVGACKVTKVIEKIRWVLWKIIFFTFLGASVFSLILYFTILILCGLPWYYLIVNSNSQCSLYNLGVVTEAYCCYEKAALERPMYTEAYCNMGVIYKNSADLEMAITCCYER